MDTLSSSNISGSGGGNDITNRFSIIRGLVKAPLIVPLLKLSVFLCLVMSVMLFVERIYMAVVITLVKLFGKKPEKRYKWEPLEDDAELGNSNYPMVLVQIPMYNEKEVYHLSIGAACGLSWPSHRIIVQVLDDSTDLVTKNMVEMECQRWASKGINIKYEFRGNRNGYKAGALRDGLKHAYAKNCDFVAIFDADFQPEPDFLWQTIPYLLHNPQLALIQARWKYGFVLVREIKNETTGKMNKLACIARENERLEIAYSILVAVLGMYQFR